MKISIYINTPTYTHPQYPNLFSNKLFLQRDIGQNSKLVFVVLKNIDKIFRAVKIAFCKECLPLDVGD